MFDGFLDDLKRMNKRQVMENNYVIFFSQYSIFSSIFFGILIFYFKCLMILVSLSSVEFWNDRFICINDMERFDGFYW